MAEEIKVWSIGEDSELFAARSEQEVKRFYVGLVGQKEAAEAFECEFEEKNLDEERVFDFDGVKKTLSLRQLVESHSGTKLPNQISTSYN